MTEIRPGDRWRSRLAPISIEILAIHRPAAGWAWCRTKSGHRFARDMTTIARDFELADRPQPEIF